MPGPGRLIRAGGIYSWFDVARRRQRYYFWWLSVIRHGKGRAIARFLIRWRQAILSRFVSFILTIVSCRRSVGVFHVRLLYRGSISCRMRSALIIGPFHAANLQISINSLLD